MSSTSIQAVHPVCRPMAVLALIGCLLLPAKTYSQDAQWRGSNRDGHFSESGLLKSWPEDGPKMIWSSEEVDEGYSTPAVTDEAIFVTGTKDKMEFLCALNKQGKQIWKSEIGPSFNGNYPVSRCTPTVVNGKVYVITGAGVVACFEASSGNQVWSIDGKQKFKGSFGIWGYSESPLVDQGKVIFTPGGKKTSEWSQRDIEYYLETGFTPDFDTVGGSMVAVQENMAMLTKEDREAIAAYLKAVPARD